jgi:uncharacterized protein YqhQ
MAFTFYYIDFANQMLKCAIYMANLYFIDQTDTRMRVFRPHMSSHIYILPIPIV